MCCDDPLQPSPTPPKENNDFVWVWFFFFCFCFFPTDKAGETLLCCTPTHLTKDGSQLSVLICTHSPGSCETQNQMSDSAGGTRLCFRYYMRADVSTANAESKNWVLFCFTSGSIAISRVLFVVKPDWTSLCCHLPKRCLRLVCVWYRGRFKAREMTQSVFFLFCFFEELRLVLILHMFWVCHFC